MNALTVIMVYQDSMPWLDMCLEGWLHFKNDCMPNIRFIFVENLPQHDHGSVCVDSFIKKVPNCKKVSTTPPPCTDGRAHEHGLNIAFPMVDTEWCMFMDADTIPVADHWLDKMFSFGADFVGPVPDSGIASSSYSLPIMHPCLMLFRTKFASPPYWDRFFGRWNRLQTPDGSDWDVCRPFSYNVCTRPDVKHVKLHNTAWRPSNYSVCFVLSVDGTEATRLALHMREGSKALLRHKEGDQRHLWAKESPFLSWYKKDISPCHDYGRKH